MKEVIDNWFDARPLDGASNDNIGCKIANKT